jgi:hypothetical protein
MELLSPSVPGVYKLVAEYSCDGCSNPEPIVRSFLVADRWEVLAFHPLDISFVEERPTIKVPSCMVMVMDWPNLTDRQVIAAFKKSYHKGLTLAMRNQ